MKKKKGKKVAERQPQTVTTCQSCGAEARHGSLYCSADCELVHLRRQVAERDEKLAALSYRKRPPRCYGRVDWSTCSQEWYRKSTFDAKRRTMALRKLGWECLAQGIGFMPIRNGDGKSVSQKMTVVTIAVPSKDGTVERPPEPEFVVGLDVPEVS